MSKLTDLFLCGPCIKTNSHHWKTEFLYSETIQNNKQKICYLNNGVPSLPRWSSCNTKCTELHNKWSRAGYRNLPKLPAFIWRSSRKKCHCSTVPVGHGTISVGQEISNKGVHMTSTTQGWEGKAEGKHGRGRRKREAQSQSWGNIFFLMTHMLPPVAPPR